MLIFFLNQFFVQKNISGIPPECKLVWIHVLSGLVWVQIVCKRHKEIHTHVCEKNHDVLTPDRRQSKKLLTIDERGSNTARNSVFDCHLTPVGRQMTIKNPISTFVDGINVFDCRQSGVVLAHLVWLYIYGKYKALGEYWVFILALSCLSWVILEKTLKMFFLILIYLSYHDALLSLCFLEHFPPELSSIILSSNMFIG